VVRDDFARGVPTLRVGDKSGKMRTWGMAHPTATFQMPYVFVVIEHEMRRLLRANFTNNPSARWTLQQLREVAGDAGYTGNKSTTVTVSIRRQLTNRPRRLV